MNEKRSSENGAVAVFVAVLILPLMLLSAFAVDTGNWWTHKRHLQTQADAAGFAGGDQFFECFRPNADPTAVFSDMTAQADDYVGLDTSSFNGQIGGTSRGTISRLYNSKTFVNQPSNPPPDDTIPVSDQNICESQMFDVKVTEQGLPNFFGALPGFDRVPFINTHARVRLYQIQGGKLSLPLAVPDITPKDVAVTFIDEANPDAALGLPVHLTKTTTSGGIAYWTGTAPVDFPDAYTNIGIRIGLGDQVDSVRGCAGTDGVPGQYICYDNADSSDSLAVIRGYKTPVGGKPGAPELSQVWETSVDCGINTGSPFFSDASGKDSCTEWVQAKVDFGGASPGCPDVCVKANDQPMTYDAGQGLWSTSFSIDLASGVVPVTFTWTNTNVKTCGQNGKQPCKDQTFPGPGPEQQGYGADADYAATGPVKVVSLAEDSDRLGSPYSLVGGQTHTLKVTVGVQGDLEAMPVPSPTMYLRFQVNHSKSITTAVACDGSGNDRFVTAIEEGCQTPYQLNPTGSCDPDPAPSGPADCLPTHNGDLGTTVPKALNKRFPGCPANNWPDYDLGDPRIVQLMVTDFSNLLGSGKKLIPVDNFATFYVTGWGGANCGANEAPPKPVPKNLTGYIWGHFIQYSNPGDTPSRILCSTTGNNIIPCVPALVK